MVYYINMIFELLGGLVILYSENNKTKMFQSRPLSLERKKIYCVLSGGLWVLISGLRSLKVGADTRNYYDMYLAVTQYDFKTLFKNLIEKIAGKNNIKDPGYNLFVKVTQLFTTNYQFFLIIIALIFMIPFLIWIMNESKNPIISFVLFSSLFYAFFAITGIRQTIATAMAVLIGDKYIRENRFKEFIIIVLVASTIHMSALVFVPFYFISKIKVQQHVVISAFVLFVVSFIFKGFLKNIFIQISGYDDYTNAYEGAGTSTFTLLLIAIYVLSIFSYRNDKDLEMNNRYYIALYLAMFFVPLTWINPSAMRVVQYFSIYLVLLIPAMVENVFDSKSQKIASIAVVSILGFLLIKSNPTYLFYWQEYLVKSKTPHSPKHPTEIIQKQSKTKWLT